MVRNTQRVATLAARRTVKTYSVREMLETLRRDWERDPLALAALDSIEASLVASDFNLDERRSMYRPPESINWLDVMIRVWHVQTPDKQKRQIVHAAKLQSLYVCMTLLS